MYMLRRSFLRLGKVSKVLPFAFRRSRWIMGPFLPKFGYGFGIRDKLQQTLIPFLRAKEILISKDQIDKYWGKKVPSRSKRRGRGEGGCVRRRGEEKKKKEDRLKHSLQ